MRRTLAQQSRVKKFNIGTEVRMAFGKALRQVIVDQPALFDRIALLSATSPDVQLVAGEIICALGPTKSVG